MTHLVTPKRIDTNHAASYVNHLLLKHHTHFLSSPRTNTTVAHEHPPQYQLIINKSGVKAPPSNGDTGRPGRLRTSVRARLWPGESSYQLAWSHRQPAAAPTPRGHGPGLQVLLRWSGTPGEGGGGAGSSQGYTSPTHTPTAPGAGGVQSPEGVAGCK